MASITSRGMLSTNDSLLQTTFYDVTDTSQLLDPWTTICPSDDSGVYLSPSVNIDDVWISADNIIDDVTTERVSSSEGVISAEFTDEQIVCICESLQQKRDFDTLDKFLSTLTCSRHCSQISHNSRETCDDHVLPVTCVVQSQAAHIVDAVLSSVAHVAFHRGRYQQLYDVLESHKFCPVYHSRLQQLWFEAHYSQASAIRHRPLGPVDKYRLRRKHTLPSTIWDGEDTVYCFKVSQRH